MPAVIRGTRQGGPGGGSGGKSGAKGGRGRKSASPAYSPTKLRSAAQAGVDPRSAVWIAAAVLGSAFLFAMVVGGVREVEVGLRGAARDVSTLFGFRLRTLTIKGGDAQSTPALVKALALSPGDPILSLDLDRLRAQAETVGWVKAVRIKRVLPDTIVVSVQPRTLIAVWQHQGQASVVDGDGAVVPEAEATGFDQLPLITGEGANEAAAQILPLVQSRPRLMSQVDAFERVDGRRWRLAMKNGGVIDLPAKGEEPALIRFDQLDGRSHVLDSGFVRIDLRDPLATEVRLKGAQSAAGTQAAIGGDA